MKEQVIILEAQNRVGGRVETDNSLGVPVELGAAWIHHAGTIHCIIFKIII